MKIKKFENLVNLNNSNYKALCFYDSGGYVDNVILFDDDENLHNHILNYVNDFILENFDYDIQMSINKIHSKKIVKDKDNIPMFHDWIDAYNWHNDYFTDSGDSFDFIECKQISNIDIDDRLKLAISTKKYNI